LLALLNSIINWKKNCHAQGAAIALFSLVIALSSMSAPATESEVSWYQIEYIIFEHVNSDRRVLQFEDIHYDLPKKPEYLHLVEGFGILSPNQVEKIPQDIMELNDAIHRLKTSRETMVYTSGAWQQPLARGQKLPPLKIDIDKSSSGGQHLMGELQIRRERYLHVDAKLYLADFLRTPYAHMIDWFLETEERRWPIAWLTQPLAYEHTSMQAVGEQTVAQNLVLLEQSRRVKDGEIHYLDHPALGLLVTIKRIDPPFEYGDEDLSL